MNKPKPMPPKPMHKPNNAPAPVVVPHKPNTTIIPHKPSHPIPHNTPHPMAGGTNQSY